MVLVSLRACLRLIATLAVVLAAASGVSDRVFVRMKKMGELSCSPSLRVSTSHCSSSRQLWTVCEPVGSSSSTMILGWDVWRGTVCWEGEVGSRRWGVGEVLILYLVDCGSCGDCMISLAVWE